MFRAATAGIDTTPHVMQVLGVAGEEGEGEADGQPAGDDNDEEAAQQAAIED